MGVDLHGQENETGIKVENIQLHKRLVTVSWKGRRRAFERFWEC